MAERRTRPTLNDRRLIADRTAKSLRLLTTPLRIYRDRSASRTQLGRRTVNLTEYLTAPPDEMDMDEDEDEFEGMLDGAGATTEGPRDNTDLYESYGTHSWVHPSLARRAHTSFVAASPSEDASSSIPPSHPPPTPNRTGPWSLPPGATASLGPSLSRQPSLRRPPRSRTVDFNDFTSRRRTTIRESIGSRSDTNDVAPPELSPIRDGPFRSTQSARRFFPFSRTRRHDSTGSFPWSENAETLSGDLTEEPSTILPTEPSPSSAAWFSFPSPLTSTSSSHDIHDTETSDERAQLATPRLRRGGVRAPESMLSRHASPVTIAPIPASPVSDGDTSDNGHIGGDAAAYPTPGSTESENTS